MMKMPAEITIEHLLIEYCNKIDLPMDEFEKIVFLFNGLKLDNKSKEKIGTKFRNNSKITVFDQCGIIDLWTINFDAVPGRKISMKSHIFL